MRTLLVLPALLAALLAPPGSASQPDVPCVLIGDQIDYKQYLCVDASDPACAVYVLYYPSGEKACYGVLPGPLDESAAPEGCVQYGQDLDYAHYVCVNLTDPWCAVYLLRESGGHSQRTCLAGGPIGAGAEPDASCVPTSGGLDYHSYLCVDPSNPRCAAYTLHHTDWGVRKTCYPGL